MTPPAAPPHPANRLIHEKSPYLLQHAHNPVDWYPWGDEAFTRAQNEGKLVFLSVGYSTCHWCHVMAHESFEDQDVAEALARDYVAIKVDREERPDVDQVYMEFCQRLTGRGGWPLTVILMPDGLPVFAATYLPKHPRQGYAGLVALLGQVAGQARAQTGRLREAGRQLVDSLQLPGSSGAFTLRREVFDQACAALLSSFDSEHGGFGHAPKFPTPQHLRFLVQYAERQDHPQALAMVETTLAALRRGGIYDQLGGGFHRYATDRRWLLPHFEKMLYDQAGLTEAYLDAWCLTRNPHYAETAREVLDYVLRDLADPAGGFHAAEDADSEGEEGRFYVWRHEEILALLGETRGERFCRVYGVLPGGNYHDEASRQRTGQNVLHLPQPLAEVANQLELPGPELEQELATARALLLRHRCTRPRPHRDDKLLTAWNGMLIAALARGGRLLQREEYLAAAQRAADFLLTRLRRSDGRLLRRWRDGDADIPAFAEDYAFFARALLELYRADFAPRWLHAAYALGEQLHHLFSPPGGGALFDSGHDADALVTRPRTLYDGAYSSANAAAVEVFRRLHGMTGDPIWASRYEAILAQLLPLAERTPQGFTGLLTAAMPLLAESRELVIVGELAAADTRALLAVLDGHAETNLSVLLKTPGRDDLDRLVPFTASMSTSDGAATAYLCRACSCQAPTTSPAELHRLLET